MYVSSPEKAVLGSFKVDSIVEKPTPDLWEEVEKRAGISNEEFYDYYKGIKVGVGIFLKDIRRFNQPVELHRLRNKLPNLKPPQSFRYLTPNQFNIVNSFGVTVQSELRRVEKGQNILKFGIAKLPQDAYFIIPKTKFTPFSPVRFIKY